MKRKMASRNKTMKRCGRKRSRKMTTRSKRGGMFPARRLGTAAAASRSWLQDVVVPLLTKTNNYITRANPQANDPNITKYEERYYRTFADIPIDTSATEDIIRNLKEELSHPVKNIDKLKTLHDKIMKTLEDEKRKQQQKENAGQRSNSTGTPTFTSLSKPVSISVSSIRDNQPLEKSRMDALSQFVKAPFGTPNVDTRPEYSSSSITPAKPRQKSSLEREDVNIDEDDLQLPAVLFDNETPTSSPFRSPPPLSSSSTYPEYKKKTEVFSPVRKLTLDT